MIQRDINIRPVKTSDFEQLELWRHEYLEGDLDIPFGYINDGIETAVAEKDGTILAALQGKKALVCDPLIMNPTANRAAAIAGIVLLERALAYNAQIGGAVEAYITIPKTLTDYHRIVERAGYERILDDCYVFRRALKPHTVRLLRDEANASMVSAMDTVPTEQNTKDVELELEPAGCEYSHELSTI